jgi:hypothetical protein
MKRGGALVYAPTEVQAPAGQEPVLLANGSCPPHHWLIAPPDGPICHAQCRKCKARRTYDAVGAYEGVWSPTGGKKKAPR